MAWTTADLIAAVRRQAFMPDVADLADSTRAQLTDAEILAIGDEELSSTLTPLVRAQQDEIRVTSFDTAITAATMTIALPERAMVRAVRRVHYVDVSGRESYEIEELPPADGHRVLGDFGSLVSSRSGWYFAGDGLYFPALPSSGSVRIYYERALPRLALVSQSAKIKLLTGFEIKTDNPRPSWIVVGELVDLVRGSSPYPLIALDRTVTVTAGADVFTLTTFDTSLVSQPEDYVTKRFDYACKAGESCYPPLRTEWHAALAACITTRVLEAIGDTQAALVQRGLRDQRIEGAIAAATPRNAGRGQRIVNRASALRSPRRWGQ